MDLKKLHYLVEENHWFLSLIALLIFTNIFLFVVEETASYNSASFKYLI